MVGNENLSKTSPRPGTVYWNIAQPLPHQQSELTDRRFMELSRHGVRWRTAARMALILDGTTEARRGIQFRFAYSSLSARTQLTLNDWLHWLTMGWGMTTVRRLMVSMPLSSARVGCCHGKLIAQIETRAQWSDEKWKVGRKNYCNEFWHGI